SSFIKQKEYQHRDRRTAARSRLRTNLTAYEPREPRARDRQQQRTENPGVDDVRNVEPEPLARERQQKANAVSVGPIEQKMHDHTGSCRDNTAHPRNGLAADQAHEQHQDCCNNGRAQKRMRDPAMMLDVAEGSAAARNYVRIRSIRSKQQNWQR